MMGLVLSSNCNQCLYAPRQETPGTMRITNGTICNLLQMISYNFTLFLSIDIYPVVIVADNTVLSKQTILGYA